MAFYYNTTHGPVAFNLANGDSCVLPSRQWVELATGGVSADLLHLLERKVVIRQERAKRVLESLPSSKPLHTPAAAPAAAPAPVPTTPAAQPKVVVVPAPAPQVEVSKPVEAAPPVAAEVSPTPVEVPQDDPSRRTNFRNSYRRLATAVSVPSTTTSDKNTDSDADATKPTST